MSNYTKKMIELFVYFELFEIKPNKLEYKFCVEMQLKNKKKKIIYKNTQESPSLLEEHERQPSLFKLIYFNMKDIHGQFSSPDGQRPQK